MEARTTNCTNRRRASSAVTLFVFRQVDSATMEVGKFPDSKTIKPYSMTAKTEGGTFSERFHSGAYVPE
jgi:hypothetical protein